MILNRWSFRKGKKNSAGIRHLRKKKKITCIKANAVVQVDSHLEDDSYIKIVLFVKNNSLKNCLAANEKSAE